MAAAVNAIADRVSAGRDAVVPSRWRLRRQREDERTAEQNAQTQYMTELFHTTLLTSWEREKRCRLSRRARTRMRNGAEGTVTVAPSRSTCVIRPRMSER